MTHAVIYVRQSLDVTGLGAAVERQLKYCRALCKVKGYDRVTIVSENDTSASKLKPRPLYKQMLLDAKAGKYDVIVAWHVDRLCRRILDLEEVITTGLPIVTVTGDIDLSTDVGRMVARIITVVAQAEVERKAARQRAGNLQRAEKGMVHAAPKAFGYEPVSIVDKKTGKTIGRTLKVVPSEAAAIRWGFKTLIAGGSLRGIAAEWNRRGHLTSKGQPWRPRAVRDRLRHEMYAGILHYNGSYIGKGDWKPLVSEETWRAAVAKTDEAERKTTPGNERKYVLSGLARCGWLPEHEDRAGSSQPCGALMATGRATGHMLANGEKVAGKRTYQCSEHKHLSRNAQPIDELIDKLVIAWLESPDAADLLVDDTAEESADIREQLQALRTRKRGIAKLMADPSVDLAETAEASALVDAQIMQLQEAMPTKSRVAALKGLPGPDAAKRWHPLTVDRKRAVVNALMEIVLLQPGKGSRTFDPETVQITMRDLHS